VTQRFSKQTAGTEGSGILHNELLVIYVFEGERYLGWDCFAKDVVRVGTSGEPDILLKDSSLPRLEIEVRLFEGRVFVFDPADSRQLRVNGEVVRARALSRLDVVNLGRYNLKVQKRQRASDVEDPDVRLPDDLVGAPRQEAFYSQKSIPLQDVFTSDAPPASEHVPAGPAETAPAFQRNHEVEDEKDIGFETADRLEGLPVDAAAVGGEIDALLDSFFDFDKSEPDLPPDRSEAIVSELGVSDSGAGEEAEHIEAMPSAPEVSPDWPSQTVQPDQTVQPIQSTPSLTEQPSQQSQTNQPDLDETPAAEETEHIEAMPSASEASSDWPNQPDQPWQLDQTDQPVQSCSSFPSPPSTTYQASQPTQTAQPALDETPAPEPEAVQRQLEQPAEPETVEVAVQRPAAGVAPETVHVPVPVHVPVIEDDEEDEEDLPAAFCLFDRLNDRTQEEPVDSGFRLVEVVRARQGVVVDVSYLAPGESYCHQTLNAAYPIARNNGDSCSFFYDRSRIRGRVVLSPTNSTDTDSLCTPEYGGGEAGGFYTALAPPQGRVELLAGGDVYAVRLTAQTPSPELCPEFGLDGDWSAKPQGRFFPNLMASTAFHILVVLVFSLFISIPSPNSTDQEEPRFVQINAKDFDALAKQELPPKPKPKPKPKPPVKTAKVATVKPKQKPSPKNPAKRPEKSKPAETVVANVSPPAAKQSGKPEASSASPDAGGGHGGNALNRNIKQQGILGALSFSGGMNLGVKEAAASVTNLDVAPSARSSEAAVKVAGIVGNLGDSKIAAPTMGLVNTKGSGQVVASAGVSGNGSVAALARGETGKNQVMAMVSADLKAPVNILGGMSREEVRRVIDQHMDEITSCYEAALIEDASLMGKMAFEWRILESGKVGEVRIQNSTVKSDALHSCIKVAIKSWGFPEPRGATEVVVSYPFIFDVVGF